MERFRKIQQFLVRERRHVSTAAIVLGFVFDSLTLSRSDSFFAHVSFVSYLSIIAGSILLTSLRGAKGKESVWLSFITQFSLGNLASGLLVLYSQSGTIAGGWVFFSLLLLLIVGNEFLQSERTKRLLSVSMLYLLFATYLVLLVPILLGEISVYAFILAGFLSLLGAAGYLFLLYIVTAPAVRRDVFQMVWLVCGAYVGLTGFYFFNLIPPVPLSLQEIGIYHDAKKEGNTYVLLGEDHSISNPLAYLGLRRYFERGDMAYCFSSIFAPAGLATPVRHHWEVKTEEGWRSVSYIPYLITGGRQSGYRGYSIERVSPGFWRCSVETERGALVGRQTFEVREGVAGVSFETVLK